MMTQILLLSDMVWSEAQESALHLNRYYLKPKLKLSYVVSPLIPALFLTTLGASDKYYFKW